MTALNATYWIRKHPRGLELTIDDGGEAVVMVISPEQWAEMKAGGDKVLRCLER